MEGMVSSVNSPTPTSIPPLPDMCFVLLCLALTLMLQAAANLQSPFAAGLRTAAAPHSWGRQHYHRPS